MNVKKSFRFIFQAGLNQKRLFIIYLKKIEKAQHIFEKQHIYPFVYCLPQKKMLLPSAKTHALLYLSHVWRVIKSSVAGGGPRGEKRMHDRERCHSAGRRDAAASVPFFLTAQGADFGLCVLYDAFWNLFCSLFLISRNSLTHTAGQETLVRWITFNNTRLLNYLPVRLTLRHFHGTLRDL